MKSIRYLGNEYEKDKPNTESGGKDSMKQRILGNQRDTSHVQTRFWSTTKGNRNFGPKFRKGGDCQNTGTSVNHEGYTSIAGMRESER